MIVCIYEVHVEIDLFHLQDFSIELQMHSYPFRNSDKNLAHFDRYHMYSTFVGDARFRLSPQTVQRVGDVLQLLAERLTN